MQNTILVGHPVETDEHEIFCLKKQTNYNFTYFVFVMQYYYFIILLNYIHFINKK